LYPGLLQRSSTGITISANAVRWVLSAQSETYVYQSMLNKWRFLRRIT